MTASEGVDPEGFTRYGAPCVCGPLYTYAGAVEPGGYSPDCPCHGSVTFYEDNTWGQDADGEYVGGYPQPRRVVRGNRQTRLMVAGRIRTDHQKDVTEVAVVADVGHPKGPLVSLQRIPGQEFRRAHHFTIAGAFLYYVFSGVADVLREEADLDNPVEASDLEATLYGRGNQR